MDSEALTVRIDRDQLAQVDRWREHQAFDMSRPEAVRRLVSEGLMSLSPDRGGTGHAR